MVHNFTFLSFSFHLPFLFKLASCGEKYFPFLHGVIKKLHVSVIKAVIFPTISFKIVDGCNTFSQRILSAVVFTDSSHLHYPFASFCFLILFIVLIISFLFFSLCTLSIKCHRQEIVSRQGSSLLTPKGLQSFFVPLDNLFVSNWEVD